MTTINTQQQAKAIMAGLRLLQDKDVRVPASDMDDLAVLRDLLAGILNMDFRLIPANQPAPQGVGPGPNPPTRPPEFPSGTNETEGDPEGEGGEE